MFWSVTTCVRAAWPLLASAAAGAAIAPHAASASAARLALRARAARLLVGDMGLLPGSSRGKWRGASRLSIFPLGLRVAAQPFIQRASCRALGTRQLQSIRHVLAASTHSGGLMPSLDPASLPQHTDRLFRAAWALTGSREDAQDLVQETFARVLARPRVLHGQDELAYLLRVLRNTFLTQRRTASRRPQISAQRARRRRTGGPTHGRSPRAGRGDPRGRSPASPPCRRITASRWSPSTSWGSPIVRRRGPCARERQRSQRASSAPGSGSHATSARAHRPRNARRSLPSRRAPPKRDPRVGPTSESGNRKGSSGVFTTEGPRS